MKRYLGIGTAVLLVLIALFLPRGWFAIRDAASLNNIQEESLAPLMVAELDRSYESRVYERIRNYVAAQAMGDVICSSKDIDPGNESLQEELDQALTCALANVLQENGYISLGEKYGGTPMEIESCTQYVLIRESDGQILLVANDILLSKENGFGAELLIDGVDGTVYYLSSEEYGDIRKTQARLHDGDIELWYWVANDNYAILSEVYESAYFDEAYREVVESATLSANEDATRAVVNYLDNAYSDAWIYEDESSLIFCYRLLFDQNLTSWSLEVNDMGENNGIRIQVGFEAIVSAIPDMAQRIELTRYNDVFDE